MLGFKALCGAGWSVMARTASRAIDFVSLLILARILSPADFGLTAIAMSVIAIVDMVLEVPLFQALTRLRTIGKEHLDTAFTLGLLRGLIVGAVLAFAAWPVAALYDDTRLFWLILLVGIGPASRGLYSPAMAVRYRELNFRTACITDVAGKVLAAGVALAVLFGGWGYWAIAVNGIASSLIPTLLSYVLAPYRPALSLSRFSDFSSFTGWFTASQILAALNWQYDRVFLGYHIDKANLGRYTVASDIAVLPTQSLIGPAMRPVMAAFAMISDDPERLRSAFRKASRLTMLVVAPIGVGIALTAEPIVAILLGPQWIAAVSYLQWLALSVICTAYIQPLYALCLAIDRPDLIFRVNLINMMFRISAITIGFYLYSLDGVLYAQLVASVFVFLVCAVYVRNLAGLGLWQQIRNLWQMALSCLIMSIFVVILQRLLPQIDIGFVGRLIAMAVSGALIYVGSVVALGLRPRTLM